MQSASAPVLSWRPLGAEQVLRLYPELLIQGLHLDPCLPTPPVLLLVDFLSGLLDILHAAVNQQVSDLVC